MGIDLAAVRNDQLNAEIAQLKRDIEQLDDERNECLQLINANAPAACELEDCRDMRTAVRRLVDFAWHSVSQT